MGADFESSTAAARDGIDHRFVIVAADGRVAAAGTSRQVVAHRLVVDLKGRLKPGAYTAQVALALGDNLVSPEIATVGFRVEGSP